MNLFSSFPSKGHRLARTRTESIQMSDTNIKVSLPATSSCTSACRVYHLGLKSRSASDSPAPSPLSTGWEEGGNQLCWTKTHPDIFKRRLQQHKNFFKTNRCIIIIIFLNIADVVLKSQKMLHNEPLKEALKENVYIFMLLKYIKVITPKKSCMPSLTPQMSQTYSQSNSCLIHVCLVTEALHCR